MDEQHRVQRAHHPSFFEKTGSPFAMRTAESILLALQTPECPPPDTLRWTCPVCGLMEPLWIAPARRWIKRSCVCQQAARQQHAEQEKWEAWNTHMKMLCYGGWLDQKDEDVIRRMSAIAFEHSDHRAPEHEAVCLAYAQQQRGNLVFCGDFGTGKTWLEAAICNYRRDVLRQKSLFCTAPDFFAAWDEANALFDKTRVIRIEEQAFSTPLLVMDDLDKECCGERRQVEIHRFYYRLFNSRYTARRPTMVSTNTMHHLEQYLGRAATSRLMAHATVLHLQGEDYRLEEEW